MKCVDATQIKVWLEKNLTERDKDIDRLLGLNKAAGKNFNCWIIEAEKLLEEQVRAVGHSLSDIHIQLGRIDGDIKEGESLLSDDQKKEMLNQKSMYSNILSMFNEIQATILDAVEKIKLIRMVDLKR